MGAVYGGVNAGQSLVRFGKGVAVAAYGKDKGSHNRRGLSAHLNAAGVLIVGAKRGGIDRLAYVNYIISGLCAERADLYVVGGVGDQGMFDDTVPVAGAVVVIACKDFSDFL